MFNFKLLALSYIFLQVSWAANIGSSADEFSSNELNDSIPLSSEEAVIKANWLPICQQVEANQPEVNIVTPESNVAYLPSKLPDVVLSPERTSVNGDGNCEAPNGLGLKNLIQKSKELIPYPRLKTIIEAAMQDEEVKRFRDVLKSKEFQAKVHDLIESPHFIVLRDYVCRALNLDIKHYVQFVKELIAFENPKDSKEKSSNFEGRAGVYGLIQDLKDALPKQQLRDLYASLLASDEQLVTAVQCMKSIEFRQLFENLLSTEEFNKVRRLLTEASVPLQSLKELIDTALGWRQDELDQDEFDKI